MFYLKDDGKGEKFFLGNIITDIYWQVFRSIHRIEKACVLPGVEVGRVTSY